MVLTFQLPCRLGILTTPSWTRGAQRGACRGRAWFLDAPVPSVRVGAQPPGPCRAAGPAGLGQVVLQPGPSCTPALTCLLATGVPPSHPPGAEPLPSQNARGAGASPAPTIRPDPGAGSTAPLCAPDEAEAGEWSPVGTRCRPCHCGILSEAARAQADLAPGGWELSSWLPDSCLPAVSFGSRDGALLPSLRVLTPHRGRPPASLNPNVLPRPPLYTPTHRHFGGLE